MTGFRARVAPLMVTITKSWSASRIRVVLKIQIPPDREERGAEDDARLTMNKNVK